MKLFSLFRRQKRQRTWVRTPPTAIDYADEYGRRHRADAPYMLPKDMDEVNRLDFQHYIFRHILRGNIFAPVQHRLTAGCNVLDVGCGTGIWGKEVAHDYPHSQVVGFDLEDIKRTGPTPANYQFCQGNLLDGLPFADQQFQYVHQRAMVVAIPIQKWPYVVRELRRVTQPGGWIELVELGTTFHQAGPATKQFLNWWEKVSFTRGIDTTKMSQIGEFLERGGLSRVQTRTRIISIDGGGGRVGDLLKQDILAAWPGVRSHMHTILDVPPEEFDAVIGQLTEEWRQYHTTYEIYFACGQA